MDDLIERLERASEGSRELDALLAVATFKTIKTDDDLIYAVPVRCYDECAPGTYWYVCRSGRSLRTAPNFTTSLDAALSLVPEGWCCGVEQAGIYDGTPLDEAWCWPFESSFDPDWQNGQQGYRDASDGFRGAAKTLALALCAAALRALASAKVSEAAPALTAAISSWKMEP